MKYYALNFDLVSALNIEVIQMKSFLDDFKSYFSLKNKNDEDYWEEEERLGGIEQNLDLHQHSLKVARKLVKLKGYQDRYNAFKLALHLGNKEQYYRAKKELMLYTERYFLENLGCGLGWEIMFSFELEEAEKYLNESNK
ncbi:hypothetical protein CG478_000940 [Bacillus cytotoxicus]|uniref:hypothetical protein n=1 Tax=Bacillus cytotoxicus TaxID=580165 RepID=UPI000B975076|nr:hypothetical protein [Bacillus cytotoxicus]AWC27139.1 hypothetical protein CG483_000940 [Bacillus cytotoxicus]AWC39253.1 hypothetical protein CG480_000940 [Bacillus cytotoxicus]AWC47184.1 hypothetical protein CG478_000940 [Bacillus cytotoxicus]AWC51205.1 hypothetical protein CG477_000940 [Bacillus cytotoxicus]AWC55334.1 hypothetical protein CG476_000940 [Bacillus cytotoxicus]